MIRHFRNGYKPSAHGGTRHTSIDIDESRLQGLPCAEPIAIPAGSALRLLTHGCNVDRELKTDEPRKRECRAGESGSNRRSKAPLNAGPKRLPMMV